MSSGCAVFISATLGSITRSLPQLVYVAGSSVVQLPIIPQTAFALFQENFECADIEPLDLIEALEKLPPEAMARYRKDGHRFLVLQLKRRENGDCSLG